MARQTAVHSYVGIAQWYSSSNPQVHEQSNKEGWQRFLQFFAGDTSEETGQLIIAKKLVVLKASFCMIVKVLIFCCNAN